MSTESKTVRDERIEKTHMVHLGPFGTPPHVTYCGAVTAKNLPDDVEAECVVCIEMARLDGFEV